MTPDIQKVADGLSDDQKQQIMEGACLYGGDTCFCISRNRTQFREQGLIGHVLLTPLGETVRQALSQQVKKP